MNKTDQMSFFGFEAEPNAAKPAVTSKPVKVKVLSADGRLSAAILMLAPFALGAVMHMSNPEFMSTLWTDPMGLVIVRTLVVLMVIGYFILRKITRIRV